MYVYGHILINWSGIFKVKVADIKIKKVNDKSKYAQLKSSKS